MADLVRHYARLGRVGARELGVSLFGSTPGERSPVHIHHGNEEMLLVLSRGTEAPHPDGTRERPGASWPFPRGPEGAHQIANRSDQPVRVLVFSTMNSPEVTELVSTGTTFIRAGSDVRKTFGSGSEQDFMALWRAAFEQDAHRPHSPTPTLKRLTPDARRPAPGGAHCNRVRRRGRRWVARAARI